MKSVILYGTLNSIGRWRPRMRKKWRDQLQSSYLYISADLFGSFENTNKSWVTFVRNPREKYLEVTWKLGACLYPPKCTWLLLICYIYVWLKKKKDTWSVQISWIIQSISTFAKPLVHEHQWSQPRNIILDICCYYRNIPKEIEIATL